MSKRKKSKMGKLGVLVLLVAVAGVLGYHWGLQKLHERIQLELSRQMDQRVYLEQTQLQFPFDLHLKGIRVFKKTTENVAESCFLEIDDLIIRPNLFAWIGGEILLENVWIERGKLYLGRNPDGTLNVENMLKNPAKGGSAKAGTATLSIKSIALSEGIVMIQDEGFSGPEGLQTLCDDLKVQLNRVQWPVRPTTVTHFSIASRINPREGKEEFISKVMMKGWINWLRRDLQAHLEVENLDIIQIGPYLKDASFFSSLESCRIQLSSEAKAVENILTAQCRFRIADMVLRSEGNLLEGALFGVQSSTIWEWIERSGRGANLEVIAKGHLQPFKVSSVQFSTDFMRDALASSVSFKAQKVVQQGQEVLREGAEKVSKAVDKTGIPGAVEKITQAAEETKDSIDELLP